MAQLADVRELLGTNRTRMPWKLRAWRRAWDRRAFTRFGDLGLLVRCRAGTAPTVRRVGLYAALALVTLAALLFAAGQQIPDGVLDVWRSHASHAVAD